MDMIGYVFSFIAAIITSFIAWLLSVKIFKPQIGISTDIVTKDTKEGKNRIFKFKIQNQSLRRDIYDISVYATYCFASKNYYSTRIRHLPMLKVRPAEDIKTITADMEPYEMKIEIQGPQTKENIRQSLEDFFENASNSGDLKPYIDIEIIAYDKFSGSVKYAYAQRYFKENIKYEHVFLDRSLVSNNISDASGHAYNNILDYGHHT